MSEGHGRMTRAQGSFGGGKSVKALEEAASPRVDGEVLVRRRLPSVMRNEWLWSAVVLVVVTVATWLRVSPEDQDVVWAEDGLIFLVEQLDLGTLGALFQPYAGYQHFLPRLFAAGIVEFVPLEYFNRAVFAACAVFAGLVAAGVFRLTRDILRWLPARFFMALVTVVVPLLSLEIIGNLADLHTYCLWLAAWIAVAKVRTKGEGVFWAAVMLIACLTEVQALLLIPVLLVRLFWDRSFQTLAVIVGAFIGVGAQLATWVGFPRPMPSDAVITAWDVVVAWLVNAVMPIWNGSSSSNTALLAEHGVGVAFLALLPFAVAALTVLVFGRGPQRFALIVLLFVSAGTFGGSLMLNPVELFQYGSYSGDEWLSVPVNLRYGAAAALFVLATIPFAASVLVTRFSANAPVVARSLAWAGMLATFVFVGLQGPEVGSAKTATDLWEPQVRSAREQCAITPNGAAEFEAAPGVRLFELDCADVMARAGG